jgi:hypothetical protein
MVEQSSQTLMPIQCTVQPAFEYLLRQEQVLLAPCSTGQGTADRQSGAA